MRAPAAETAQAAVELVQELVRLFKVRRLYAADHPQRVEVEATAGARIQAVLDGSGVLDLGVEEEGLRHEGDWVHRLPPGPESIGYLLYREGMRQLTFYPGVETGELTSLLDHLAAAAVDPGSEHDLIARLWNESYAHVRYVFVEQLADEEWSPAAKTDDDGEAWTERPPVELRPEDLEPYEGPQVLRESAPALYSLEEDELARLQAELEAEKARSLDEECLTCIRELLMEPVHDDPAPLLGTIAEMQAAALARDDFAAVLSLHEIFRPYLERGPGHDVREAFGTLRRSALAPPILDRLGARLAAGVTTEDAAARYYSTLGTEDLGTLLRGAGDVKKLCQRPAFAAAFASLATSDPEALARVLTGDEPGAACAAAYVAGLLAVPDLVEPLAGALQSPDAALRREALLALKHFPGDRAVGIIAGAIADPDPTIRVYALRHVTARRYLPALPGVARLFEEQEAALPLPERRLVCEAYGTLGGPEVVDRLAQPLARGWFRKPDPDTASCAVVGLAATGTDRARSLVQRVARSRNPLLRRVAQQALDAWSVRPAAAP